MKKRQSAKNKGNPKSPVIYGQDVLYAARGRETRSRPAQAGIQWF